MKTTRTALWAACLTLSCLGFAGEALPSVPIKAALKAPESFCSDPLSGDYFISNVNGDPRALDDNGFITRLGADLKVRELKFIAGGGSRGQTLNGPKGMAVLRKTLYVADINTIRAYSLPGGGHKGAFVMTRMQVKFLNDITVMNDKLYVTDTFGQKIYEVDPGLTSARLVISMKGQPNGIVTVPGEKKLLVATWGPGKLITYTPRKNGTFERTLLFDGTEKGVKDLDGVVFDKAGNIYVSSWTQGKIYRLTPKKAWSTIASGVTSPADIGIDARGRLLMPFMNADTAAVMKPLE